MSEQFALELQAAIAIGLIVSVTLFALGFYALKFRGVSLNAAVERGGGSVTAVLIVAIAYGVACVMLAVSAQVVSNYVWIYFTTAKFPDRDVGRDVFATADVATSYLGLNKVLNFILDIPTIFAGVAVGIFGGLAFQQPRDDF